MIQFDEEDSILQAKYAIREKRHPNQWPKCEKIDNKNSVNLFKSFQYKFPETLIIDEKDSISTKEFQEKIEKKSTPALLRGYMEDWNCYKKTLSNGKDNEKEWTLEKLCTRNFINCVHFQCGVDKNGIDVSLNLREYMEKYVIGCNDRNPMLIFDAIVMEQEEVDLINDFACPALFSQDDYLKHIDPISRPPFQWFIYGPKNSGSPVHQDPMGTQAWNALCSGKKLWILFHPATPKELLPTKSLDIGINNNNKKNEKQKEEDIDLWEDLYSWIYLELPEIRRKIKMHFDVLSDLRKKNTNNNSHIDNEAFWYREFLQMPGEIVFVPSNWHHAVFNLEDSIAVTQNYCSRTNLSKCYTLMEDRLLAKKWLESMKINEPNQVYQMIK